jgi:hypothetical protein
MGQRMPLKLRLTLTLPMWDRHSCPSPLTLILTSI